MPSSLSRTLFLSINLLGCLFSAALFAQASIPLPAHSHNDYERPRPLFSALQLRFASVEADVYLVNGELLVGHDPGDLMPGRTLGNLYLEPLRLIVMRGVGQVYPETTSPLILLVDIKSEAAATYQALERALAPYERFLTRFTPEEIELGAVTVVVTGNRPREIMANQAERYAGYDGRLTDLTSGDVDRNLMPLISDNWDEVFSWRGGGPMPEDQRQQLVTLAGLARENGVKLRFWNTPDIPPVWEALYQADVDLINADRIDALSDFLASPR
jgi:glycerophosphoryl diester phosphodiesterase